MGSTPDGAASASRRSWAASPADSLLRATACSSASLTDNSPLMYCLVTLGFLQDGPATRLHVHLHSSTMSGTRLPRALARVDPTTRPASDAPTTRLISSRGASLFCLLDAKAMLDRSVQMFNILADARSGDGCLVARDQGRRHQVSRQALRIVHVRATNASCPRGRMTVGCWQRKLLYASFRPHLCRDSQLSYLLSPGKQHAAGLGTLANAHLSRPVVT